MRAHLRLAAVLAHSVPAVTLELHCRTGDRLIVADRRLDAHLTTCQFRTAVAAPVRVGVPHLTDAVEHVHVRCGVDDIGAGIHRRTGDDGEERWLVTYLPADVLFGLFTANPLDLPDEAMAVSLRPGLELGATAVRITAMDPGYTCRLDEVALWAMGACVVEELVRGLGHEMSHR